MEKIQNLRTFTLSTPIIRMELNHPGPGRMNEPKTFVNKSGKEVWAAEIKSEKPVNQQNRKIRQNKTENGARKIKPNEMCPLVEKT